MSDPRNVAHDKKVRQEKQDEKPEAAGKKAGQSAAVASTAVPEAAASPEQGPVDLEKSVALLSKLKEMEFHSRANIEALAQMALTIDDELKQKEFSDRIGDLYSTQDQFHSKIAELIQNYEAHVESLKPSA